MKQLKYRVWDHEQKCWIEDSEGFGWWTIDTEGKIELHKWPDNTIPYTPGRFDILLWTGGYDKKKNEIYDGHIIQATRYNSLTGSKRPPYIYVVEMTDTGFVWDSVGSLEIIGHKHTHPELLPGKEGGE